MTNLALDLREAAQMYPDHPAVRLVRDAGMALVNRIGPARRFFMQEAGGAVGDLLRLLKGEAL